MKNFFKKEIKFVKRSEQPLNGKKIVNDYILGFRDCVTHLSKDLVGNVACWGWKFFNCELKTKK